MKLNPTKLFALLFVFISLQSVKAQSLNVKDKNGNLSSTSLSSIQKLTFNQGQLIMGLVTGVNEGYALSNIQYINFANLEKTASIAPVIKSNFQFSAYPNPVIDVLTISLKGSLSDKSSIRIYTIDGKLCISKNLSTNNGDSEVKINLSCLPTGSYICNLTNGTSSFISKFQKH
jgi:hypothetical protein